MLNKKLEREPVVDFNKVVFGYDKNKIILKNISFSIFEDEYVCIIGHNGSGKSTIAQIMVGLLKPQMGSIKLFNQTINSSNIKQLRENVGIVFQNPDSQFISSTVEDDIAFGLENKQVDPTKMWDIIQKTAKIVDITTLLKFDAIHLSGGQKQRVAIATILATDPKIIIFDEATSMLDPKGKKELKDLMLLLKQKYHKTIVSITHDMEEVLNADRVIVMNKGQIVQIGMPEKIFSDIEKIKALSLDVPYAVKLSKALNKNNCKFKITNDLDALVKEISYEK